MKKSSLLLFVLISSLAMIYSPVSVRPAVAADQDPCWGNGKCSGSSCTTIEVIFGIKETCKWNDSQGIQWSQTCSIHLTKGSSNMEVRLNGCDKSSKTETHYEPPPQSNHTSPVNDTGNATLPFASVFNDPMRPHAGTNNSAVNNTITLPTLAISKEKNSAGNATNLNNDTGFMKSSHKSGGHHHHNDNESNTDASTNSSASQNSQLPEVS